MLSTRTTPLILAVAALIAYPSAAADTSTSADALASLMDETAIAVARVDLARLESDTLMAVMAFAPELAARARDRDDWLGFKMLLSEAGAESLDLIIETPRTIPFGSELKNTRSLCVLPAKDAASAERIADVMRRRLAPKSWRVETRKNLCISGPQDVVEQALNGPHPPRPHLADALKSAGDAPLVIILAPSADQRRVLGELLPDLPAELGGDSLRQWGGKTLWTTIAYDPGQSFRVIIQAETRTVAETIEASIDDLLGGFLSQIAVLNAKNIQIGPLVSALKKRVENDQIVLSLEPNQLALADNVISAATVEAMITDDRREAMNRFKQIGIAMHNYHDAVQDPEGQQHFPDTASRDAQGRPLLSWRVHLLPFLRQGDLYKEFHLDEPWDSEHNRKLIERMPDGYRLGNAKQIAEGKTCIVVPVGKNTLFPDGRGMTFREITDGTARTIMIVEVDDDHAVIWTKPDDLQFNPAHPTAGLGGHFGEGFLALIADGSCHFIPFDVKPNTLRAMFTPAGGEALEPLP